MTPFSLSRCVVFDLECYPGRWCVGFGSPSTEGANPEFQAHHVETPKLLKQSLREIQKEGLTLVGYNSERFDVPLLRAILKNIDPYAPAQHIISEGRPPDALKSLPAFPCDHIDLSARLRRYGAFPGLKTVAANMGRPVLRELPFVPGSILTDEQWDEVRAYNLLDLEHTWALLERLAPELSALTALSAEFGQDLRSVSQPQVVERVFLSEYRKANDCDPIRLDPPSEVVYRPLPGVVRPRTEAAVAWYDQVVNRPLPMVAHGDREAPRVPAAKFKIGKLALSVGAGGLHSVDSARVYYATKRHRLVSVDVASFYPSLIATKGIAPAAYGDTGRETYRAILDRRLQVKATAKKTDDHAERGRLDVQANGLKLIVNSFFGKMGDPYSTLYDPAAFLAVTLSGQLMLIDLIERLTRGKVRVISANTDGLFLLIPRAHKRWRTVLKKWQADTGMKLDVEPLKRLAVLASNQYATRDVKDRVKRKGGELRGELDWSHTPNALVVNDAIANALLFDVPTEKTVFECRDMVRFCSVTKRSSKAVSMVLTDGKTDAELPKVTRWYRARDSRQRIEVRFEDGRHTTPAGAQAVAILQDLPAELPADVDWGWYRGQARRKVQNVPGYRHRSTRLLPADGPAHEVRQAGLVPVPKRAKAQPAGSDVKHPTLLWDWPHYPTVGCYTGPAVHTLVVDVDVPEKFRAWVEKDNLPVFGDRWNDLVGSLTSAHGDATAEGVRSGTARGKLIFTFDGGPDHPLTRVKARWLKTRGVEVFFGNGLPSVLGQYGDNCDRYRLEGTLGKAPDWLIAGLTPKERVKRPAAAAFTPEAKQAILEGLPAELADREPLLADSMIGWRLKEISDGREIWIGRCPTEHSEHSDGELSCGVGDDGPYVRCMHANCQVIQDINRRLKVAYASKIPTPSVNGAVLTDVSAAPVEAPPVNQEALDPLLATWPRTDTGNAERLVARFGNMLRFCHPWRKWLVWMSTRWKLDDTAAVNRMVKKTVRAIFREASCLADAEDADKHAKHKSASETRDRRNAMADLATSEEGIPILPDELDMHPWLFNCLNGTLDLRTGILGLHDPAHLITQLCPVDYRPEATCPLWDQTLALFLPDTDVRAFFQKLCGYAMAGVVRDHILPVCYGTGSNGKTTILTTLQEVIGPDYAMKAPPDLIMVKKNETHPTERADLFRKRLVLAIETEEGRRLNETLVKEYTGGDRVRVRRMREDYWEFSPTHTLFLATNHKPVIRDTTASIWRRIKEVPFTVKMEDDQADTTVLERLRAEYRGILAWCVRGCLAWQRDGLKPPESVIQATEKYRESQDVFGSFLDEHVEPKQNARLAVSVIYDLYKAWADASNAHCLPRNLFGQAMGDRGYVCKKSGHWYYADIELRKPEPPGGTGTPY